MFAQTACTTDNNMISKVHILIQYILAGVEKWLTMIYVTFPYHTPTNSMYIRRTLGCLINWYTRLSNMHTEKTTFLPEMEISEKYASGP